MKSFWIRWEMLIVVISVLGIVSGTSQRGNSVGVLDFTCYSIKARIDINGDDDMVIGGYKSGEDWSAGVEFGRSSNTGTSSGLSLPAGSTQGRHYSFYLANLLGLPQSIGVERIGSFYCYAYRNGVDERITTIIMSSSSTITPRELSQTVSVGQPVTFNVDTDVDVTTLRWRHNGADVMAHLDGQVTYTIPSVTLADAGVYECYQDGKRGEGVHAIFQLIVRECPQKKWNPPSCDEECPYCFNGGICDDHTGQCVCAPGFIGQYCKEVHGRNAWGQDGRLRCSGTDEHGYGCQGKLFCMPNPLGCSCAAGFKGLDCDQECEHQMYGASCRQECHCAASDCRKDTGECFSGPCATDWYGINCQEYCPASDLEPITNLRVISTTVDSISVEWDYYHSCPEFTQFVVEYSASNLDDCLHENIAKSNISESKEFTISGLGYATYRIEVKVVRQLPQLGTFHSTPEFVNQDPVQSAPYVPTNIEYQTDSNSISVSWDEVPCEKRGGPGLHYEYLLTDANENILRGRQSTTTTSASFSELTECLYYIFEIRSVNDIGPGDFTSVRVNTNEIGPGPVTSLQVFPISSSSLRVTWAESGVNNCRDREDSYRIDYRHINTDQCSEVEGVWSSQTTTDTSVTLTNLLPHTTYEVSITTLLSNAIGEDVKRTGITHVSIPSGPPEDITVSDITSNAITFEWLAPECGKRRGEIMAYSYTLTEIDGSIVQVENTAFTLVRVDGLKPLTNYSFSIAALTGSGAGPPFEVTVKTREAVPSAPTNLRFTNIRKTSMTAMWEIPQYPNGVITKYTVQYHAITKPYDISFTPKMLSDIDSIEVSADDMEYLVDNLEPSTEYRVVVIAHSKKGAGEKAVAEQFTGVATDEEIPPPPKLSDEEDIGDITTTTVKIKIPLSSSHFVTGYQVGVQLRGIRKRQTGPMNGYIAAELLMSKVLKDPTFIVGDNKTYGGFHNKPLTEGHTYTLFTGAVSRINGSTFAVVWSDGLDVDIAKTHVTDSAISLSLPIIIVIAGIGFLLIATCMCIIVSVMAWNIRSLNKKVNNRNQPNGRRLNSTDQVTTSDSRYEQYGMPHMNRSYQDLYNDNRMSSSRGNREYAYPNESIMRSQIPGRNNRGYENEIHVGNRPNGPPMNNNNI